MQLSPEQLKALHKLWRFIQSDGDLLKFFSEKGNGKTTVLNHLDTTIDTYSLAGSLAVNSGSVEDIVSDEQMNEAWANADFGACPRREVLRQELLKLASGYHTGKFATCILQELLLVDDKLKLTKLGQHYLYAAFGNPRF